MACHKKAEYSKRIAKVKWYEKTGTVYWYDQYALNEAETAFSKYDPDRIVTELLELNADIYTIYAANQCNIAYYPSKFIPKHPNLGDHDYVEEIVPRLRRKGKKVVLYANWLDTKHPEWNIVPLTEDDTVENVQKDYPLVSWADPSKEEWKVRKLPAGEWFNPCVNSPKRELMKNIIRELTERYEFDGFHLDMFFHTCVCVCSYCKPFLKKIFGKEDIRWKDVRKKWYDYIKWRFERSSSYIEEVTAILKSHNRDIVSLHNAMSPLVIPASSGLSEEWLPHLDVYLSECFDIFECRYADMNSVSLQVKFHRAVRKPSWILLTSTPLRFGHSPVSKAKFLMYASAAKTNGCQVFGPCGVGARQDTTTDRRLLDISKDAISFWNKDLDNFNDLESAAEVAVVYSFSTRAYYESGVNPARYAGEFNGWCRLLIERHIPFNIEIAELLDDATAQKYKVLILPNTACADFTFENIIKKFVAKGGKIIATAQTSLYNNRGEKKKDFGLSDVLGISYMKSYESNYFYVEDKVAPIICGGDVQCVKTEARILARLVKADPSGSPSGFIDPLPLNLTDLPLCTKMTYNKGKAYYIAWEPCKFYMDHGYWQTAEWISELLEDVVGNPVFSTNAPRTVELMVWKDEEKNRLVAKFSNRTVPQAIPTRHTRSDIGEIIPVHNIALVLRANSKKIKVFSPQTKVRVTRKGEYAKVTLEKLDAYASVVIEGLL